MSEAYMWIALVCVLCVMGILLVTVDMLERLLLFKPKHNKRLLLDYKQEPLKPVLRVNIQV